MLISSQVCVADQSVEEQNIFYTSIDDVILKRQLALYI